MLVFTGIWLTFCFLEIFYGYHAAQMKAVINDQHFLYTFFVHFLQHNFAGFAFLDRHQAFFRCHHRGHRLIQISHKANITASDDPNQFVIFGHHRIPGKTVTGGQFFNLTEGRCWGNSLWLSNNATFMFFHAADFFSLALNGHIFVNETQTAFLCQRNGQTRFGNGIHGCGQHRNIQADSCGQLSAKFCRVRQDCGVGWNQENVIKC